MQCSSISLFLHGKIKKLILPPMQMSQSQNLVSGSKVTIVTIMCLYLLLAHDYPGYSIQGYFYGNSKYKSKGCNGKCP